LKSRKKQVDDWSDYPFLTQRGVELIKRYTEPRIFLDVNRYASYRDYGESTWRIGYGSKRIGKHIVGRSETATTAEIEKQLIEDLKDFSKVVNSYVFVPLNSNKKGALLSFAHSIGIYSFKESRLLHLINSLSSKAEIIREWSPYINQIWICGGERLVNRRRAELDLFYAADKEIPTQLPHKCKLDYCLLNLAETFNGASNQIKAIEYLESKIKDWDPDGKSLRYFFRLWNQKPAGLSSAPRLPKTD